MIRLEALIPNHHKGPRAGAGFAPGLCAVPLEPLRREPGRLPNRSISGLPRRLVTHADFRELV